MRRLPFHVGRVEGESWTSYVERLAAECGSSIAHTLHALGVIDAPQQAALPRGWGIDLPPRTKAMFADGTGLDLAEVDAMLLRRFDQVALDLRGFDPSDRDSSREIGLREWVYLTGSHICALCLAEDEAWQLAWKLPWSVACSRHGVLLVDTCPDCKGRIGGGQRLTTPPFATRRSRPGFCANPRRPDRERIGRGSTPCGYPLTEIPALPVARNGLVATAQASLDVVLTGACSDPTVCGIRVLPMEYFRDLRLIASWLHARGALEALADVDAPCADAFSEWTAERDRHRRRSRRARSDIRVRSYTGAPQSASLMGALASTAVQILDLPLPEAVADRLRQIDDLRSREGRQFVTNLLRSYRMSAALRAALKQAFARDSEYAAFRANLRYRQARESAGGTALTSEGIPLIMWEEVFDAYFGDYFAPRARRVTRRFCSLALARVVTQGSWAHAAEALGCQPSYGRIANHYVVLLARYGTSDAFFAQVAELAAHPLLLPEYVDYRSRERMFREWEFDLDGWRWVTTRRIGPPTPLRAWPAGGAWLWAHLTGLDWMDAPALAAFKKDARRRAYKKFERDYLPLLRDDLLAYEHLLTESAGQP